MHYDLYDERLDEDLFDDFRDERVFDEDGFDDDLDDERFLDDLEDDNVEVPFRGSDFFSLIKLRNSFIMDFLFFISIFVGVGYNTSKYCGRLPNVVLGFCLYFDGFTKYSTSSKL